MSARFRALLQEGLKRFAEYGPPNDAELQEWLVRLQRALDIEVPTDAESAKMLRDVLSAIYGREVERGGVRKRVPEVLRYTIDRVAPQLRAELDRRIFTAADLIRINKTQRKAETLRRFAGWISSVPIGGKANVDLRRTVSEIAKPIRQIKFEARRVAIDQGHKLNAAVAHIVAEEAGSIAAIWHDRGEFDKGYDARPEHLKRSGKIFLVRDSWAAKEGLIARGGAPYTDEIEQVGELPYCSCYYEYISSPGRLPDELLSSKGREWIGASGGEVTRLGASARWHSDSSMGIISNINNAVAQIDPRATPAQIAAGTYRKGHVRIHGLDVTIENGRGTVRTGIGADGLRWAVLMPAHYGYIRRARGADGEQLDVYLGPDPGAERVWIVEQTDLETGEYDEDKVLLGFPSRSAALRTYRFGFSDGLGRARIGAVRELGIDEFKRELVAA